MDLKLHIVNFQNETGDRDVRLAVGAAGVTLGRGDANDVVLDDPERVVSGQHARLDVRNGGLWLTDTSRNGTFLNRAADPLPSNEPVPLHDGDCFTLGPYEIRVGVVDAARLSPDPAVGLSVASPLPGLEKVGATTDILDLLLPGQGTEGGLDAIGADFEQTPLSLRDDPFADALPLDGALGGRAPDAPPSEAPLHRTPVEHVFFKPEQYQSTPEDYDLLNDAWLPASSVAGEAAPVAVEPVADRVVPKPGGEAERDADPSLIAPSPGVVVSPEPLLRVETPPDAPPERTKPAKPDSGELAAFLAGLGVGRASDVEHPELLLREAGELLRALATGLTQTLISRARFKSELRLGVTTIRAAENNPFKFSVGTDDLLDRILFRPSAGFMAGPAAAREAFEDIQAHEMAMTAGLQAAMRTVLARFAPDEIAHRLGDPSGLDVLLRKGRKARYWDLFAETYEQVCAEASEDVMQLCGDAFARAYKEQIQRLRLARG